MYEIPYKPCKTETDCSEENKPYCSLIFSQLNLTLSSPGFFWGAWAGGGGGQKVPAAHNSKTIHGTEMKFGRVVENHKLINLV